MCGVSLLTRDKRKYKSLQALAESLEKHCIPTAFAFSHIQSVAKNHRDHKRPHTGDEIAACCIACVHWVKRLDEPLKENRSFRDGRKKIKPSSAIPLSSIGKPLLILPIDNLFMFLCNPGGNASSYAIHIPVPDKRTVYRLMRNLSETVNATVALPGSPNGKIQVDMKNPYLMFCSPVMMRIIQKFGEFYGAGMIPEPVRRAKKASRTWRQRSRKRACTAATHGAKASASPKKSEEDCDEQEEQENEYEDGEELDDDEEEDDDDDDDDDDDEDDEDDDDDEEEEEDDDSVEGSSTIIKRERETANVMDYIVYWWWESTGMPTIMPHKTCAKYVRKAIRKVSMHIVSSVGTPLNAQDSSGA
jgi:hypothetical protein